MTKRASIRSLHISPVGDRRLRVRTEIRVTDAKRTESIRLNVLCQTDSNPTIETARRAALKRSIELLESMLVPGPRA